MAFDGFTIAAVTKELSDTVTGLRIYKIAQPEADELLLTVKGNSKTLKLLISADASLPLIYFTDESKPSPLTAPGFCMLLRKHLNNAKIISVTQPGLERIIKMELEHLDEMGDIRRKFLIIEMMGKHSNIIFTDENNIILDSIKHISHNVSSVREVLPGREYFIVMTTEKRNPLVELKEDFLKLLDGACSPVGKYLYSTYTGLSPVIASEMCYRAKIDSDFPIASLTTETKEALWDSFYEIIKETALGHFKYTTYIKDNVPREYGVIPLHSFEDCASHDFQTVSDMLVNYYKDRSIVVRSRQKSADLRKITQLSLERNVKKLDLQLKQLKDTGKKDKYKLYGEMITAYGYTVPEGSVSFEALNYYTNETVTVPLDKDIKVMDNAKKYFDKYSKLKRTAASLEPIIAEVRAEIEHLDSILVALDIAVTDSDLTEIKEELVMSGYIKHKSGSKKEKADSKPLHFIVSDGYDVYVGKNNLQNDRLTFEFAKGGDWWFHAKKMPGSHVIVRTKQGEELPDKVFEEAASLAAYYSKGRGNDRVEIDYTIRKNVKKPQGAKPGFVIYYTNYSMIASGVAPAFNPIN